MDAYAPVTTQVTVDRNLAEAMLGSVRAHKLIATEVPDLFATGEALRYAGAELVLVAALDRINYLENRPSQWKRTLRQRLAAHLACPTGPKAW